MTIAVPTGEPHVMPRLIRSRHALDTYLARGRIVAMTVGGLNTGPARLVVTVAGQPPIALADDALIARATLASYAALGLREWEQDRAGAG